MFQSVFIEQIHDHEYTWKASVKISLLLSNLTEFMNRRIMVLDQGLLKEFDRPDSLLKNEQSIFYSMAKEANLV